MIRFFATIVAACTSLALLPLPAPAETRPNRGGHVLGQNFQIEGAERMARARGGHALGPDLAAAAKPIAKGPVLAGDPGPLSCYVGATDCAGADPRGR